MARKRTKKNKGITIIKKANNLIESRYKFDIWETRFFLSVLSQIRREDEEFEVYRVWYKDVIKTFALKSGDSYGLLRNAASSLMEKTFSVRYETDGVGRETKYHILRKIDYLRDGQEGKNLENHEYIDVTVEQEMKPLLLQLQKNFTTYDLRNVVRLGVYPVRIYELLKQYETIGNRTLGIDDMKKMFEITNEYPLFANFFQKIIKPSVKEINEHTDINITKLEKVKEGRKVVAIRFWFQGKKDEDLKKARGEIFQQPLELPFPNSGNGKKESQEQQLFQAIFDDYFKKLNDWWGIEEEQFTKRVGGKEIPDIEAAIEFTKSRIKAGKADNPAGVFLEALSKGHRTAAQHKAVKKKEREKQEKEKQERLKPLLEEYSALSDQYAKKVNDTIREITQENPAVTEQVIEKIKATYKHLGVRGIDGKTIEDFRKNPMLRAAVKTEIMKDHPERFSSMNTEYGSKIEQVKSAIRAIEPEYRF